MSIHEPDSLGLVSSKDVRDGSARHRSPAVWIDSSTPGDRGKQELPLCALTGPAVDSDLLGDVDGGGETAAARA